MLTFIKINEIKDRNNFKELWSELSKLLRTNVYKDLSSENIVTPEEIEDLIKLLDDSVVTERMLLISLQSYYAIIFGNKSIGRTFYDFSFVEVDQKERYDIQLDELLKKYDKNSFSSESLQEFFYNIFYKVEEEKFKEEDLAKTLWVWEEFKKKGIFLEFDLNSLTLIFHCIKLGIFLLENILQIYNIPFKTIVDEQSAEKILNNLTIRDLFKISRGYFSYNEFLTNNINYIFYLIELYPTLIKVLRNNVFKKFNKNYNELFNKRKEKLAILLICFDDDFKSKTPLKFIKFSIDNNMVYATKILIAKFDLNEKNLLELRDHIKNIHNESVVCLNEILFKYNEYEKNKENTIEKLLDSTGNNIDSIIKEKIIINDDVFKRLLNEISEETITLVPKSQFKIGYDMFVQIIKNNQIVLYQYLDIPKDIWEQIGLYLINNNLIQFIPHLCDFSNKTNVKMRENLLNEALSTKDNNLIDFVLEIIQGNEKIHIIVNYLIEKRRFESLLKITNKGYSWTYENLDNLNDYFIVQYQNESYKKTVECELIQNLYKQIKKTTDIYTVSLVFTDSVEYNKIDTAIYMAELYKNRISFINKMYNTYGTNAKSFQYSDFYSKEDFRRMIPILNKMSDFEAKIRYLNDLSINEIEEFKKICDMSNIKNKGELVEDTIDKDDTKKLLYLIEEGYISKGIVKQKLEYARAKGKLKSVSFILDITK